MNFLLKRKISLIFCTAMKGNIFLSKTLLTKLSADIISHIVTVSGAFISYYFEPSIKKDLSRNIELD